MYTWDGMKKISHKEAVTIWEENKMSVFLLYPDNTENLVKSLDDFEVEGVEYGIERGK